MAADGKGNDGASGGGGGGSGNSVLNGYALPTEFSTGKFICKSKFIV